MKLNIRDKICYKIYFIISSLKSYIFEDIFKRILFNDF